MQYTIVHIDFDRSPVKTTANQKIIFVSKVNKLIEDGWEPIGGICFDNLSYTQAMIKK